MGTTDTAIELLRSQGMRMTPQRIAIVDEIMHTPGYLVPLGVIERVKARVPGVSASTVYRTLERLEELGVLSHVHLENGVGYHQVSEPQHAHLTCTSCGKDQEVSEAVLSQLERSVEAEHGFRPDFSHHPISGLCASCLERGTTAAGAPPG
jgi:Fur family transcriptional regulator, ferric uptake regulator